MTDYIKSYPRDMVGYGEHLPDAKWPNGARIAITIGVNYEGGGELNILHGDASSEYVLTDVGLPPVPGARSMVIESSFEYGSRRGIWRLLRILRERNIRTSVFGVVTALELNPAVLEAMIRDGHEIVSHGYRWIDYQNVPEHVEREHIRLSVEKIKAMTGQRPLGWMTGRGSPNTRRLLIEEGGFVYDRDSICDELPYWDRSYTKPHLVIPMSLETNDNRCDLNAGFSTSDQFYSYMKDAFDVMYREGEEEPKIMALNLHDRIIGRPGRAAGLERFLDYALKHDKVWFAPGLDIANHWKATHPAD
jgi:allantoinase